ncbi:AFG1-like ATPase [Calocera viscosa TUFC12733]|uniref:AFG1-like ATPase n=1 Tax=Calocera viscosa (strain TUFC12733) TaxID=1330018 RepID=A0A167QSD6_CALVF|nr:AFG1-like ATPase [Calocera viscosa TUFC12733]
MVPRHHIRSALRTSRAQSTTSSLPPRPTRTLHTASVTSATQRRKFSIKTGTLLPPSRNSLISKAAWISSRYNSSAPSSSDTPTDRYNQLVERGLLKKDPHQLEIVALLQELHDRLRSYNPPPILEPPTSTQSMFGRFFGSKPTTSSAVDPIDIPQGLYLYGDVGTGKSMLMDLFYDTLPPNITRKRRIHFHAFMIDVHKRIQAVKNKLGAVADPIPPVARDLANEGIVLCFDEFQVTDIADAMILRRLMESLLEFGVVFVMTSNRHPDDLYKNGIQRESFVPCINLIKERLAVTDLNSGTDYRRMLKAMSKVYYSPLDRETSQEMDKLFTAIAEGEEIVRGRKLSVWGRDVVVPESTSKVAKFKFSELCGGPRSAADYLEITKNFPTIFVTDIPKMGLYQKDLARRFITFIDACYESKTKVFASSEVPIFKIFSDEGELDKKEMSDHIRHMMDDLGLDATKIGTTSLFSGDEELFAFARAVSRLTQMGTKAWAETAGQQD